MNIQQPESMFMLIAKRAEYSAVYSLFEGEMKKYKAFSIFVIPKDEKSKF